MPDDKSKSAERSLEMRVAELEDKPGQSACPVTLSLSAQSLVTQQAATGASRLGACAPIALISGVTSAGRRPSARAISFGVRPFCRNSATRSASSLLTIAAR